MMMMIGDAQGTDWQKTGGLLASQCKDKMLRVFDPRTGGGPTQVLMMMGMVLMIRSMMKIKSDMVWCPMFEAF